MDIITEEPTTSTSQSQTPFELQEIKKPEELLQATITGSPYDFAQMFPMEKGSQRRLAKKKLKQLKVLDPIIRSMLHEGEEVIYITDGVKVSNAEQFFIGWMMYYYNHNAFVFTNQRILLIHVIKKTRLGKFIGAIRYEDLMRVKANVFGNLRLKFRNKKQILFTRIAGPDRQFIKDFLTPLIAESEPTVDKQAPMIVDLCPACYEPVTDKHAARCSECGCEFRTPKQAAIRSLILPGLGDIYLGSALGYLEVVVMLILWSTNIMANLELVAQGEDPMVVWIGTVIFFAVIHLLDAAKSHHVGSKGIFPKESISDIRSQQEAKQPQGFISL